MKKFNRAGFPTSLPYPLVTKSLWSAIIQQSYRDMLFPCPSEEKSQKSARTCTPRYPNPHSSDNGPLCLLRPVKCWTMCCIPWQSSVGHCHNRALIGTHDSSDVRLNYVHIDRIDRLFLSRGHRYLILLLFTRQREAISLADNHVETTALICSQNWNARLGDRPWSPV